MKRIASVLVSVALIASACCLSNLAIAQSAPAISFSLASVISSQGTATPSLRWSVTNADSCAASGGWSGSKALTGTETESSITISATYTLACQLNNASAQLSWVIPTTNTDNTPLTDIAGYNIYAGSSAGTLAPVAHLVDPRATGYLYSGGSGSMTFAVTLVNSQGVESALSNLAVKTLTPATSTASVTVNIPNPPMGVAAN